MRKLYDYFLLKIIGRIMWPGLNYLLFGKEYDLSQEQIAKAVGFLNERRYIILTYRKTHLTTYFISFSNLLLRGKWGRYSHAAINIEAESARDCDLKITEAIGKGVVNSRFWEVFNCDRVALLDMNLSNLEWDEVADYVKSVIGSEYDTVFNFSDDKKFSCVELPYQAIKKVKPEAVKGLTALLNRHGKLTPDMYIDSGDFKVAFVLR